MNNQEFERVVDSIREEDPGVNLVDAAAERMRTPLVSSCVSPPSPTTCCCRAHWPAATRCRIARW